MIKRIKNIIQKDIVSARRDNIILYTLLAPIIISIIMTLVVPTVETATVSFAVESSLDNAAASQIGNYGEVETFANRKQIINRVEAYDDAIGVVETGNGLEIILEGNEAGEVAEIAYSILNHITREGPETDFSYSYLEQTPSLIKEYTAIMVILMIIMVSGVMAGFNIIDEKESGAIRALAVTPLRLYQYMISRAVIVLLLSLILSLICTAILLGTSFSYIKLIIGTIFSSSLGVLLGTAIGAAADNQIKGIALFKAIAFPFTLIPVASIFIPEKFHPLLYPFPNYWAYRVYKNIFIGYKGYDDFWLVGILTLFITLLIIVIVTYSFKKKIKLR